MSESSQGSVGLVVKLPFTTPEEFLARYGANITRGGIYLRSKTVKPPGTPVTLDLRLSDGTRVIHATAKVHFVTGQTGSGIPGMGLRFLVVDPQTQRFLESMVAALPHAESTEPPIPHGVGEAQYGPDGPGVPMASPQLAVIPHLGAPPAAPSAVQSAPPALKRIARQVSASAVAAGTSSPAPKAPVASPPSPAPAPARPTAPESSAAPQVLRPTVSGAGPVINAPPFEAPTEDPKREGPIIGIDLGTTNSCAAFVRNGKPNVLASREGHNTVPSIIALNARGRLVVGHPARGQMLTNPRLTVYGSKRLVGRAYDSPIVQHVKERFHYEITPGESGEAAVKLGDRVYSLQQISAMILREVRDVAQNQLGQQVSRAVITVPAYYNDNQRQAVREAGRLAGLHVERIVNEPTAAALAFGYGRQLEQRIMLYDLGGGTFDASILELSGNVYEVISTGGDTFLGGIDFDTAVVNWLLADFERKNGRKFEGDRVAMQRIYDAAERAKCALSERNEIRIHVPFVTMIDNQPLDLDVVLTRDKLTELTGALVDRTIQVCDDVLKAKGLTPDKIDEVILVGGQSRFPVVHDKITRFFGKAPSRSVHPDEAVALGAALLAYSLGQLEGVVLIDVLPMAIGVGLPGGRFKPILERNTALPTRKTHHILTSRDDQETLEVTVFQGDSDRAQENEYLGTLKLSGLPKGPRGTVGITITFELSNEALLKVTAREDNSGREVTSTFSTRDTPEAVKARLEQENEALQEAPVPNVPAGVPSPEAIAATSSGGGFFGWLKRLFGGT
ncbi:MAG: TIGR02266 family protein [Myxococcaceae bacterium]